MCIKLRLPPRGDRERVQQHLEFVEPPGVRVVVRVVRVVGQDALGDAARRRLADGQRRDAVEWFRGLDAAAAGHRVITTERPTLHDGLLEDRLRRRRQRRLERRI